MVMMGAGSGYGSGYGSAYGRVRVGAVSGYGSGYFISFIVIIRINSYTHLLKWEY